MEYLDKRIKGICDELKKLSIKQRLTIDGWKYKKGVFLNPAEAREDAAPFEAFDGKTMHWYGPDKHYWFSYEGTVPQEFDQKPMWLRIATQIDEWDDGKNPQFLLFVNGEAVQGIDMNHREVLLNKHAKANSPLHIEMQAYTGTLHTEFSLISALEEIDREIEGLYYDLRVPLDAFPRLETENAARMDLERVLNNGINLLDMRSPYSPAFYESIAAARKYLEKALYTDLCGSNEIVASCIGHTHIDVAWWWTVEQTRQKVARSFTTVLKLMEEYPSYKFMSSQPQLYVFLKERYPEIYEKVKQRVKENRWEPEGGMWVEADCNLTSGESLVRQFVHGKRFFKEEFGLDNRILWLPDVFGYSGALPQIMAKCGIDYFMTTKLAWNQFNKIPNDTFMWRGIDGSEILTHLITTLGVGQDVENFFTTYNGMLHPDAIIGGWQRYQNKDINNDILISYGYGDGGGGPTREMLETSVRMEKGIKGLPRVRQEFSRTYFNELDERVRNNPRLPLWEGELYFEYHRGTYTSMARNKRSNRKAELGMMDLELLSVLTANKLSYPAQEIDNLWKGILINQFHDILPGTSIEEVYEVTKAEYEHIEGRIKELCTERTNEIAGSGQNVTVFNTTGFERNDIVKLGQCKAEALKSADGKLYPVQQSNNGAYAYVEGLPSKGYKSFEAVASHSAESAFTLNGSTLETPFYTLTLDENGLFEGLFDKDHKREVLQAGKSANLLRMYEDKPIYYDNWDIDIYYTEKYWDALALENSEWQLGPVMATLVQTRVISNSSITQKIHFYANSRRIDFETVVDWHEHQHLLKAHFPVNIHTDEATFEIQFGNLTRKTHTNTSWDKARFESCGQKWMDLSEGHYGVSLLNDCKYGHSVKDSCIGITLIKSGIEPNPNTDNEMHYFTYSLYPHGGNWRSGGTVQQAYNLNQPALCALNTAPVSNFSTVSADKANAVIETVKQADNGDGIIVRVYECDNALTPVCLSFFTSVESAEDCNMLEEKQDCLNVEQNKILFTLKPYEVKTIRVRHG